MKKRMLVTVSVVAALLAGSAMADGRTRTFNVDADGFQEVPAAIFTTGLASLSLRDRGDRFEYTFSFKGLTGNIENSVGAHIHFGRPGVNGGIIAFICGTSTSTGPAETPACISDGQGNGLVVGTIRAEDILEVSDQGFPANDLDAFREAVQARATYLNVHTDTFPSGEIRGDFQRFR